MALMVVLLKIIISSTATFSKVNEVAQIGSLVRVAMSARMTQIQGVYAEISMRIGFPSATGGRYMGVA